MLLQRYQYYWANLRYIRRWGLDWTHLNVYVLQTLMITGFYTLQLLWCDEYVCTSKLLLASSFLPIKASILSRNVAKFLQIVCVSKTFPCLIRAFERPWGATITGQGNVHILQPNLTPTGFEQITHEKPDSLNSVISNYEDMTS